MQTVIADSVMSSPKPRCHSRCRLGYEPLVPRLALECSVRTVAEDLADHRGIARGQPCIDTTMRSAREIAYRSSGGASAIRHAPSRSGDGACADDTSTHQPTHNARWNDRIRRSNLRGDQLVNGPAKMKIPVLRRPASSSTAAGSLNRSRRRLDLERFARFDYDLVVATPAVRCISSGPPSCRIARRP